MHGDESDVRDHVESGTKLLTRKPLTKVDQYLKKRKPRMIFLGQMIFLVL